MFQVNRGMQKGLQKYKTIAIFKAFFYQQIEVFVKIDFRLKKKQFGREKTS